MSNTPDSLLPVVYVSPLRPLGILRVMVTDHRPVHGVDDGVAVTTQIGAHLQSAHRAPLVALVGAPAVQPPQIVRWPGLDKNETQLSVALALRAHLRAPQAAHGAGTAVENGQ